MKISPSEIAVSIVAPDEPGVLAAIAGVLTAHRVDVLGAEVGHADLDRRLVVDVFAVRDLKGDAIPDDPADRARGGVHLCRARQF